MVGNALGACCVGLVNVHTLHWASKSYGLCFACGVGSTRVDRFTADGVVEDEDFGGASAGFVNTYSSRLGMRICLRSLENILDFGIIDALDVFIIEKIFFLAVMFEDLESGGVQSIFIF